MSPTLSATYSVDPGIYWANEEVRGGTVGVDHLNLEVEEGEILGIQGPNGPRKSSALMLSTIIKPTEGTAEVGGYDIMKNSNRFCGPLIFFAQVSPFSTVSDR